MNNKKRNKHYVVFVGRETGIFDNWADCKNRVHEFPRSVYKSYSTYEQAEHAYSSYIDLLVPSNATGNGGELADNGFFAVLVGWREGVYLSRREADLQTKGYVGRLCEEYYTLSEAMDAVDQFFVTLFKYNLQTNS